MNWHHLSIAIIQILLNLSVSYNISISNDVATENYAEVRHILNQFYAKATKKYNPSNDYNPGKLNERLKQSNFHDGTEVGVNINEGIVTELFENDIILTLPQARNLLKEVNNKSKRQAIRFESNFWPTTTVHYSFGDADQRWRNSIRQSLAMIQAETCIKFVERLEGDHLFFAKGGGCWSSVGRVGGRQTVSIGGGCEADGIIVHETLHALGLWHEQSRDDRDNFITIHFGNIFKGTEGNFERRSVRTTVNLGQNYDMGSVMHYGSKAFTTDYNKRTIQTKDSLYQNTIGQRSGLSFKDAKMINIRYCSKMCATNLMCYRGGYVNPNNCQQCTCPPGWGGRYCETVEASSTTNCGGVLKAKNVPFQIESPSLSPNTRCIWHIQSPSRIEIKVDKIVLPCQDVCSDYIELKYKSDMTITGPRLCCQPSKNTIVSDGNDFIIIFNGAPNADARFTGFVLSYKIYESPEKPVTTKLTESPYTAISSTTNLPMSTAVPAFTVKKTYWSDWGEWSECTVSCGGCGQRRRIRICYGDIEYCRGASSELEECGKNRCPRKKIPSNCNGRVLLPCDLYSMLKFGTLRQLESSDILRVNDQLKENGFIELNSIKNNEQRRTKRSIRRFCEKRFSYFCLSNLLTLTLDWKSAKDSIHYSSGCCNGYYASDGICVKS